MPERYRPPSADELRGHLEERRARLADLKARGVDALSRYDIEIAHGGNADQALATARWLLTNQIAYYGRQLKPFEQQPQQSDFFAQLAQPTEAFTQADQSDDPVITTP